MLTSPAQNRRIAVSIIKMKILYEFMIVLVTWVATSNSNSLSANPTAPNIFQFKGNLSKIHLQWILNGVTPSYMKDFINLYHQQQTLIKSDNLIKRVVEREFLDKIFDGVTSNSCKVHVTEWFTRFSFENFEGLLGSKDAWVLQSKLKNVKKIIKHLIMLT